MLSYVLLVIGFAGLIKGADWLVDGASSLAHRFGVSHLIIGLTIVSLGTSLPEIAVTIFSVAEGRTDLAVGNVAGSNVANVLLVLGLSAMIAPIFAERDTVWKEIPFCLLAAVMLGVVSNDALFDDAGAVNAISRTDGMIFLLVFLVFLYYLFEIIRNQPGQGDDNGEDEPWIGSAARIVVGLVVLVVGGQWVVNGAVELARALNMSERVIGLTVVAIGTSLPELATSVVAAVRKNPGIALGNVVGSNIFNILLVLGIGSQIAPLPIHDGANFDVAVVIIVTVALFVSMVIGIPRRQVNRWEGAVFVAGYFAYLAKSVFY
jgi:cation:H+ antiporter